MVKNVAIFGVDDSSSTHTDNRKIYISFLEEGPGDGLDETTTMTKAK